MIRNDKRPKMESIMERPSPSPERFGVVADLLAWIASLNAVQGLGLALLVSLVLAGVDLATGYEVSFSLFYLVPVFLVAWTGSRGLVWGISIADAVFWQTVNFWAGEYHELSWVYVWNTANRGLAFLITGLLVFRLKQLLDRETATARHDPLTTLLNRRGLEEAFAATQRNLRRHSGPLAVISIDLDRFKQLNDSRGHAEGDRLLKVFSQAVQATVRPHDVVARVGGDEFVVLAPRTDRPGALELAGRLQRAVTTAFTGQGWEAGLSQGVVVDEPPLESLVSLLERADRQLYRAKNEGRGRIYLEDGS